MNERDDGRRSGPPDAADDDRRSADTAPSKDACFERVAALANEMIEHHGKDFAMGTLVLAAKFIAEGKPLSRIGDDG